MQKKSSTIIYLHHNPLFHQLPFTTLLFASLLFVSLVFVSLATKSCPPFSPIPFSVQVGHGLCHSPRSPYCTPPIIPHWVGSFQQCHTLREQDIAVAQLLVGVQHGGQLCAGAKELLLRLGGVGGDGSVGWVGEWGGWVWKQCVESEL